MWQKRLPTASVSISACMSVESGWFRVCHPGELNSGEAVEFTLSEDADQVDSAAPRGFVIRHDEQVRAFHNRCPHLGIGLNWRPGRFMDPDNCFIQCATHGALFLPDTGQCIAGPCQGDALTPLDVEERPDGIYIRRPG